MWQCCGCPSSVLRRVALAALPAILMEAEVEWDIPALVAPLRSRSWAAAPAVTTAAPRWRSHPGLATACKKLTFLRQSAKKLAVSQA